MLRPRVEQFCTKQSPQPISFYSGTWPSYYIDLLSPRLVGAVEARINMKSSFFQLRPAMAWSQLQILMVASPAPLTTQRFHYSYISYHLYLCYSFPGLPLVAPDEMIERLISKKLASCPDADGYLVEGFPITLEQLKAYNQKVE